MKKEVIEFVRNMISTGVVTSYDKQLIKSDGILLVKANINGFDEDILIWDNWGEAGIPYIVGSEVVAFSVSGLSEIKFGYIRNTSYAPLDIKEGDKIVYNKGVQIYLKNDGTLNISSSGNNITGDVDITGDSNVSGVYKVAGTQVVGPQQAAITAPTGGSVIDAEARTAIDSIIATLTSHGLTL